MHNHSFSQPTKQSTLCFLLKGNQILLAMKKRGLGMGKWNGVGGKRNPHETLEQATIREAHEEIGVHLSSLDKRAILDCYFPHKLEVSQQVVVFFTKDWDGEPTESEEMRPQWFNIKDIPYASMWPDDAYWLPRALEGAKLKGEFVFDENDTISEFRIAEVQDF